MDIIQVIRAVAILFSGIVGGRFLGELVESFLFKLRSKIDVEKPTIYLFSAVFRYLVYLLVFFLALSQLEFYSTFLEIATFIIILTILVTLIYSFKDVVSNAISGYYLMKRKVICPGDVIDIEGIKGRVKRITEVVIEIETEDGLVILPNSALMKRKIIKKT